MPVSLYHCVTSLASSSSGYVLLVMAAGILLTTLGIGALMDELTLVAKRVCAKRTNSFDPGSGGSFAVGG